MVRAKHRFVACQLVWEDDVAPPTLTRAVLAHAVLRALAECFGEVAEAQARASFSLWYLNSKTGLCVVRCPRQSVGQVRAALTLVRTVDSHPVMIATVHVGGTLRSTLKGLGEFCSDVAAGTTHLGLSIPRRAALVQAIADQREELGRL